jgi:hypothetical protein
MADNLTYLDVLGSLIVDLSGEPYLDLQEGSDRSAQPRPIEGQRHAATRGRDGEEPEPGRGPRVCPL